MFHPAEIKWKFSCQWIKKPLRNRFLPYQGYLSILQRLVNLRSWDKVHLWELSSPPKRTNHGPFAVHQVSADCEGHRFITVHINLHMQFTDKWKENALLRMKGKVYRTASATMDTLAMNPPSGKTAQISGSKGMAFQRRKWCNCSGCELFLLFPRVSSTRSSLLLILCSPMGKVSVQTSAFPQSL